MSKLHVVEKHYVTFYSPGTFFPEELTREIGEWDPRKAVAMATNIRERYNAVPFGFRFSTDAIAPDMPDGRGGTIKGAHSRIAQSPRYFINGKVETFSEVEARATERDRILLDNMRWNKKERVITVTNRWQHCCFFESGDINVDSDGNVLEVAP